MAKLTFDSHAFYRTLTILILFVCMCRVMWMVLEAMNN